MSNNRIALSMGVFVVSAFRTRVDRRLLEAGVDDLRHHRQANIRRAAGNVDVAIVRSLADALGVIEAENWPYRPNAIA